MSDPADQDKEEPKPSYEQLLEENRNFKVTSTHYEAISKDLEVVLQKLKNMEEEGCTEKVKDNFYRILNESDKYIIWLAGNIAKKIPITISGASDKFRRRMHWSNKVIRQAPEKVEGVRKFLGMVRNLVETKTNYYTSNEPYKICGEDNRPIRFLPYITILDGGPVLATIELKKFDKLNTFWYKTLFVSNNNKIALPEKVTLTDGLIQKIHAGFVSNSELAFDTKSIMEVDQKFFDFLGQYTVNPDCKFNLIVSPKRERREKVYQSLLEKFVDTGFNWTKMGIESKTQEAPRIGYDVQPAPI